MNKRHYFFLVLLLCSYGQIWGQAKFRDSLSQADPVGIESSLSPEEKLGLHQAYLVQARAAGDSLKQIYGMLFVTLDHFRLKDYVAATESLLEAEVFTESSSYIGLYGMVNHFKGILAVRLREYETAIDHYQTAAKICVEAGDSLCFAESMEQIASLYGDLKQFELAESQYEMVMPLIEKFGGEQQLSATLSNYGVLLAQQGRLLEAIPYYQHSIAISQPLSRHKQEAQTLTNLASVYLRLNRYDQAVDVLQKGLALNQKFQLRENLITNYLGLHMAYDSLGQYQKSIAYLKAHIAIRDSIFDAETKEQIAELELKYESQKKKLELEKSQAKLRESQRSLEHVIAFAIFLLLWAFFRFWGWRNRARQMKRTIAENRQNLSSLTRLLINKNEALVTMEKQIAEQTEVQVSIPPDETALLEESLIDQRILTEEDWESFQSYFEKSFPGYLTRLRLKIPALSEAETRLFLFIKLNLSRKEIASILGISAGSVKKTRYRLRKRLELSEEESLEVFIGKF